MNGQRPRSEPSRARALALLALAVVLGTAALGATVAPHAAGAADFSAGDAVVVTERVNLRTDPTTGADVVTVLDVGTSATVTGDPAEADGYTWYELDVETGETGWAVGDFLELAAAVDPGFAVGDAVVVVGGRLNLRAEAGLASDVLDVLPDGTGATVLDGPVTADGLPWYELDTDGYGQGWSAAGFLALSENGGATFPIDAVLLVNTDRLNLRTDAGLDAGVIDQLTFGERVVVTDGPVNQDGYDWYQLDTSLGTGWSAGEFLGYPADVIAVGDQVSVVDGTLNLRADAGLDADVLDQLPDGTALEVTDGPTLADGYTWFAVTSSDFGDGWVAGEFLQVASSSGQTEQPAATETATATATTTATATATPTT
jgi:uncharacterized protein YgiM (DUF1202 family)